MKSYFLYILRCADRSYYTGMTGNIDRRLFIHEQGLFPKCYTFTRRPVQLVYVEIFNEVILAIEREKQIKRWSRKKKEALIKNDWQELVRLSRRHGSTPRQARGSP